ncbi:MAG: alpha/beta fold hydrolase [Leptospiraceae bacterium]|nr:alpha/beta fold hydrolase [Leptospiraceae bacterium]MCP5497991.1 alpha/beta fold hydrolase [Leptospiraceae bacterium]
MEKVWSSFVNKMVALTFFNDEHIFDHAVFEVIQKDHLRMVVSASQFRMKEVAEHKESKALRTYILKAKPTPFSDPNNRSARILKRTIIETSRESRPAIEYVNLAIDLDLHPNIKPLISPTMKYAFGMPLTVKENPIGILWGVRKEDITPPQKREIELQLHALYDVIEFVIDKELDFKEDAYMARKNIEKADTTSLTYHLFYTMVKGQKEPITNIIARSHYYNKLYRLDASYIIPTANGYSVSMKKFLPSNLNSQKKIILTIPGFFCRRSVMDKISREMALRYGYIVYSMDMRGRSKHTMPPGRIREGWTIDDYIQDDFPEVLKWIKEQYPDYKIVIMGHSMGGMIPRFYTSAYEEICQIKGKKLPDPYEYISGLVAITSPNYINLKTNFLGIDSIAKGVRAVNNRFVTDLLFKVISFYVDHTLNTIDLNKFFKFLFNIHTSFRQFSFTIGRKMINIDDFVGYKQITPPEWYLLMEDIFCEESTRVILQFIRSQLDTEQSFLSFDGKINYTERQKNFKLPIYAVIGSVDALVPPENIEDGLALIQSTNKKVSIYEQGHLGIIFHPPTVKELAKNAHEWILELD